MSVLSALAAPSETIRVLHVDDEPDLGDLTATFLEREDDRFDVETATNATEGIDRLADTDVDCVVSDYDMPGQNGIEFLETVRENHPDLPFILFTGKGSEEIASDAISVGVTDYLQKGVGTDQYTVLANRITNAVEHHRSRRMVERSERRLREIIDALPPLLYVVDEDGRYLLANEALADFHDTTVGALEGSNVDDVLDDPVAEEFHDHLDAVLREGAMTRFAEVEVTSSGGDSRIFEPRLRPYDFGSTETRTVLGIARDVTDQKERELELRRKERRYQAVFNDPNILVGLIDTDGTVLDINQTAIDYVEVSLDELVGAPFWETPWFDHSAAVREEVRDWIDRAASGEYVEFEADLVRPNGDPYTIEGVFRPVTDDDGEVVSLLISDRDVTERKQHERELERRTRELAELVERLDE